MKILILFAHPAIQHSRTNRIMRDAAGRIEGITVFDLYAHYPRFDIDIDQEQRRLSEHDAIVLQFPLYWYSTPSLVKEWMDLVLEHGFAYGETGGRLKGKPWLCAITAGAPEQAYRPGGLHGLPLRHFLAPLEATANLCQMPFLPPYVLFGAQDVDEAARRAHAEGYARLLVALRDDRFDFDAVAGVDFLSAGRLHPALIG